MCVCECVGVGVCACVFVCMCVSVCICPCARVSPRCSVDPGCVRMYPAALSGQRRHMAWKIQTTQNYMTTTQNRGLISTVKQPFFYNKFFFNVKFMNNVVSYAN